MADGWILPPDINREIGLFLPWKDLKSFRRSDKQINLSLDRSFWIRKIEQEMGRSVVLRSVDPLTLIPLYHRIEGAFYPNIGLAAIEYGEDDLLRVVLNDLPVEIYNSKSIHTQSLNHNNSILDIQASIGVDDGSFTYSIYLLMAAYYHNKAERSVLMSLYRSIGQYMTFDHLKRILRYLLQEDALESFIYLYEETMRLSSLLDSNPADSNLPSLAESLLDEEEDIRRVNRCILDYLIEKIDILRSGRILSDIICVDDLLLFLKVLDKIPEDRRYACLQWNVSRAVKLAASNILAYMLEQQVHIHRVATIDAVESNSFSIFKMLVDYDLNINKNDIYALKEALERRQLDMFRLLLEQGVDPTRQLSELVNRICSAGLTEYAAILIKHSRPGLIRYNNDSALRIACYNGYIHLVRLLVEAGCDPERGMANAIQQKHNQVVKYLEEMIGRHKKNDDRRT